MTCASSTKWPSSSAACSRGELVVKYLPIARAAPASPVLRPRFSVRPSGKASRRSISSAMRSAKRFTAWKSPRSRTRQALPSTSRSSRHFIRASCLTRLPGAFRSAQNSSIRSRKTISSGEIGLCTRSTSTFTCNAPRSVNRNSAGSAPSGVLLMFRSKKPTISISVARGVMESVFDECDRYDADETGGRLLGIYRLNKGHLDIKVNGILEPGPNAQRTPTFFLQDGDHQERLFRAIEAAHPDVEHLGNWHTHHVNGLQTLSGGDKATYTRIVNHAK